MIPAGKLRHRIQIQQQPTGRDSRGRRDGDWVKLADASAEIITLSGTEAEKANQLVSTATHQITIRARRKFTLTTKHRFVFRDRVFNIGHIDDEMEVQSDWICLVTEERS